MPPQKVDEQPAVGTATLLASKDRKIARLKAALAGMQQTQVKNSKAFYTVQDAIKQAVLSITFYTRAQRKLNEDNLVKLSEHLDDWCTSSKAPSDLVADMQAAKHIVLDLAEQDNMSMINAVVEHLCKATGINSYKVAHQIILENEDSAFDTEEMVHAITERVNIVNAQEDLIDGTKNFTPGQKRHRKANLLNDIAAQLQADPAFGIKTNIVLRSGDVPQEEASAMDSSLADLVRSKLSLQE